MNKLTTALAIALAAVACNKKSDDKPAPKATEPSTATTPPSKDTPQMAAKTPEKPGEKPKRLEGKELADAYIKCIGEINAGKLDDYMNDCVDTAKYEGQPNDAPTMKAADRKQHLADMKAAFPDLHIAPQIVLVDGSTIYATGLITGTHDGTMKMGAQELPATHKKIGFVMAHTLTHSLETNKVSFEKAWMDPGTLAFQLGVLPKEAPPHRPAIDKGIDGAPVIVVATHDAKEKANVELVKKSNDAFNAHKLAESLADFADDAVVSDLAEDKDVVGKKELDKGLKMFFDAFSDIKISADTWGAGDYVVATGHIDGTFDHDMGKVKKTGVRRPWMVGIRDPRSKEKDSMFDVAPIRDHSFSTSGDYERGFVKDGVRYHHILDPRTGQPAHASRSVTIRAKDAFTADAWSKVMFIYGWKRGMEIIKEQKLDDFDAVWVADDNTVHATPGIEKDLKRVKDPTPGP